MINCKYIGVDEFDSFKIILEEKRNPGKSHLRLIQNRVETCYHQYLNDFETLEIKTTSEFTSLEVDQRHSLKICYESATGTFLLQRGEIFDQQPDVLKTLCPYCLLDKPRTLDHYISKTEFPEFSVLIRNLIPCCYDCNNRKGEVWRLNKRRRFIHFYNDNFLDFTFLKANLNFKDPQNPKISFYLEKPNEMDVCDFEIVTWHFEDLNLLEEYSKRSNTFLSTYIASIKQAHEKGQTNQEIETEILEKHNSYCKKFGPNFWESSLYFSLSQHIPQIILI